MKTHSHYRLCAVCVCSKYKERERERERETGVSADVVGSYCNGLTRKGGLIECFQNLAQYLVPPNEGSPKNQTSVRITTEFVTLRNGDTFRFICIAPPLFALRWKWWRSGELLGTHYNERWLVFCFSFISVFLARTFLRFCSVGH